MGRVGHGLHRLSVSTNCSWLDAPADWRRPREGVMPRSRIRIAMMWPNPLGDSAAAYTSYMIREPAEPSSGNVVARVAQLPNARRIPGSEFSDHSPEPPLHRTAVCRSPDTTHEGRTPCRKLQRYWNFRAGRLTLRINGTGKCRSGAAPGSHIPPEDRRVRVLIQRFKAR